MAKDSIVNIDDKIKAKCETFTTKLRSDMYFESELSNDTMSFDWINEIEFACPYLDNIFRNPKVALINEEDIVKIEKAKKITVASVKDLSKHTHFIEKIDKKTNEVQPSKILIQRNEETFNTYENRFIYTLLDNLIRFLFKKEALLNDFETKNKKVLEYAASTIAGRDKVNIELKISSKEMPQNNKDSDLEDDINSIKERIKKIKDYISSWKRNEIVKSLDKAHVTFVVPPIRKTNIILKNPNFQIAMRLWAYLQAYDLNDNNSSEEGLNTTGDNILKGLLDDSFLMSYYVLDSISSSKKEQKEKLAKYAIMMINQQLKRIISLLLNSGIDISEEEIMQMILNEFKNERNKSLIDSSNVKKKFKDAMDEYLDKMQDYL